MDYEKSYTGFQLREKRQIQLTSGASLAVREWGVLCLGFQGISVEFSEPSVRGNFSLLKTYSSLFRTLKWEKRGTS